MSRNELVERYLEGQMSRRVFIRRLIATGVSAAAALSYADVLRGAPAAAAGADFYVLVYDFRFSPGPNDMQRGYTVEFQFLDGNSMKHSATDRSGMQLFDTGLRNPGTNVIVDKFHAAGKYPYRCLHNQTVHVPMRGTINVPIGIKPKSGQVGSPFTITWAIDAAPSGFVYDVRVKKPGQSAFVDFRRGVASRQAVYHPSVVGTHTFKARMRRLSTGTHADYSDPKGLQAT
jgi:plastocyanin